MKEIISIVIILVAVTAGILLYTDQSDLFKSADNSVIASMHDDDDDDDDEGGGVDSVGAK